MSIIALQIDFLRNATFTIHVMAPAYTLLKPKIAHQGTKIGESDVGVRPAVEDPLKQSSVPAHRRLSPTRRARRISGTLADGRVLAEIVTRGAARLDLASMQPDGQPVLSGVAVVVTEPAR